MFLSIFYLFLLTSTLRSFAGPIHKITSVADPGYSVGGADPLGGGGAPTSDAYTFRQKQMRKRKKLILLGGAPAAPPGSANEHNALVKKILNGKFIRNDDKHQKFYL